MTKRLLTMKQTKLQPRPVRSAWPKAHPQRASCWAIVQVSRLSLTLKGTKPAPESVEGLAVQAEALQHLAAVVLTCAEHLKVQTVLPVESPPTPLP